jgi:predicted nucleic acid-binding protein
MKLVDTSVALDHLRGDLRATALLNELMAQQEPVAASEMTRVELLAAMRKGEREVSEVFFSAFTWVPVNEQITRVAGDLAGARSTSRQSVSLIDCVIAATALVIEADLVTTNTRRFPMLPGLKAAYSAR